MDLLLELNLAQSGLNDLFETKGSFQKIGLGDLLIELASGTAGSVDSFNGRFGIVVPSAGDYTTDLVTEGSNLYFTNARVLSSQLTGYVSGAGVITPADTVLTAIQKLNGNIAFDTAESLHIDGTNSPAANIDWAGFQLNNVALNANTAKIGSLSGILKATAGVVSGSATTSDLPEGSNLYYTQARFDAAFGAKTTDNLPEGITNLYFTSAHFNTSFATKTTDNLTEGISNLYYTDGRARNAISAIAPVLYNPGTGVVSMHVADSTHDGYLSSADFNLFNDSALRINELTTSDNTPVPIFSMTLENTSVYYLEARITSRYADGSEAQVYHINVGVRAEVSGSPSLLLPGPTGIYESDGALSADWVINGSSVELQVTGDPTKNVNWKSFVSVYAQND